MSTSNWQMRIALGAAIALTVACGVAIDTGKVGAASAEPTPTAPAAKNTGKHAGGAFLMDLSKGGDESTQYYSEYDLNADWTSSAFREKNVTFDRNGMLLFAQRERTGKLNYTSAEFQRTGNYGYGRYEAVMKTSNATGVVSSFFTHTDGYFDDPHDEIDFEFIGMTPRKVHTNIFHDDGGDSIDIPLWFDASAAEHLYAFEWSPEAVTWYVDNVKIREVTKASSQKGLPTASGRVMASVWASYGQAESWVGVAHFDTAKAFYRCMSHVPLGQKGPQCSDTFKAPPKP